VPQSEWVSLGSGVVPEGAPVAAIPNPAVAALIDLESRAATPAPALADDEREEFLKRENELSDQLQEAQTAVKEKTGIIDTLKEELNFLKARDEEYHKENKNLNGVLNDLKLQLEKVLCDNKESTITVDSLKDANSELTKEIDELKVGRILRTYIWTVTKTLRPETYCGASKRQARRGCSCHQLG
jgi:kinesin family protein 5